VNLDILESKQLQVSTRDYVWRDACMLHVSAYSRAWEAYWK